MKKRYRCIECGNIFYAENPPVTIPTSVVFCPSCDGLAEIYDVEARIEIARKAIMLFREKGELHEWANSKEYPLTYGCHGLLDYVESGEIRKIKDPDIRRSVQIILKPSLKKRSEEGTTSDP